MAKDFIGAKATSDAVFVKFGAEFGSLRPALEWLIDRCRLGVIHARAGVTILHDLSEPKYNRREPRRLQKQLIPTGVWESFPTPIMSSTLWERGDVRVSRRGELYIELFDVEFNVADLKANGVPIFVSKAGEAKAPPRKRTVSEAEMTAWAVKNESTPLRKITAKLIKETWRGEARPSVRELYARLKSLQKGNQSLRSQGRPPLIR